MDDQFKVCGNCGHCTMTGGEWVCIDPAKLQQEVVPCSDLRPCFVGNPLTAEQTEAAALVPAPSAAIN